MAYKITNDANYTAIADAVRSKRKIQGLTTSTMLPSEMPDAIDEIELGIPVNVSSSDDYKWHRPSHLPNIDALVNWEDDDEEVAYFTFDMHTDMPKVAGFYSYTPVTVERGHVTDSEFITDATYSISAYSYWFGSYADCGYEYAVYKITPANNTHISYLRLHANDSNTISSAASLPIIERVGKLPYATSINYEQWSQYFLQRDHLTFGQKVTVTSLKNVWIDHRALQEIDYTYFDTSHWNITDISLCWQNCKSLLYLDLTPLDVSNWPVTTLSQTWWACNSLKYINVSNWNTSNWAVGDLLNTWSHCYALEYIDGIEQWQTSNWPMNKAYALSSTWAYCHSLQSLNLNNWDTSNWQPARLTSTWECCYALKQLRIGNWDTSNWALTSLNFTWCKCLSLTELDVINWDTSNWAVTEINYMFEGCRSVRTIDLHNWNTNNWALTTASWGYLFNETTSLIKVDISTLPNVITGYDYDLYPNAWGLVDYYPHPLSANQNYSYCNRLTHASLLRILNSLPNGSYTLTLGACNNAKLTAAEIAIATAKGWTVA